MSTNQNGSAKATGRRIGIGLITGVAAVGAMAFGAPVASAASPFHQDCFERPHLFHPQAAWGDPTFEGVREVCRVYDASNALLKTVYHRNFGWRQQLVEPIPTAPLAQ